MSPEQFHDALNYLDDDLIAQTDDLRQGRRVLQTRPTVRQIVPWVASAACLALVLGIGPRFLNSVETADGAIEFEMQYGNGSPAEAVLDQAESDNSVTNRQDSMTCAWMQHTLKNISLTVPENWSCEKQIGSDGSYFLVICPPHETAGIRVGHYPNFAVCGTGLSTEETIIAGMNACVGTYDENPVWSYIVFSGAGADYVALNDGGDAWWGVYGDTAMAILETLEIKE